MPKSILVVDDAVSMRSLMAMTLRGAGYEVQEASDGKDALGKLSGAKFDLILTDLNMPNMDGISLIKEVKTRPNCKFLPVVMLTTESQESKKEEGRQAGAKAWIVKPFKPETLLGVVKKILG
ncbi:response regulator [Megalodesulfovibrio gigas]|uniref:Putative alkaline phosphatase synthesis transcriptional regulatory protein n=1 Tax=Megalodesulfovibrio gigas (strain ATCC 19364 / DSM 1382 / NCIMB 9332 / VKM B-1759) TaxID=1121448 RepID=T2GFI4_MEGG1|nr:response regulator [Megalodesulfovibrio gigas]AGW14944.1 putative alkaline phosphatase synthesis transcriptional regulatory protein [Megalodesulfovibrio gigas DSM 1382 = ATCC 19364]